MMATYPGGKLGAGTFQRIINQIPPHRIYIEPFVGGGAILLKKRPAKESIAYDLDSGVIARLCEAWSVERGAWNESPHASRPTPHVDFQVACGLVLLKSRRFPPNAFIYVDPPYLQTAVLSRLRYQHVLSVDDHRCLLRALKNQCCPVMVSGYWSSLYAEELTDWRTIQFMSMTRGGYPCQEWLWMNYPDPQDSGLLHDYRYVGKNYREREKFRRQQKRWSTRMANMTALQRMALMSVLEKSEIGEKMEKSMKGNPNG